MARYEVKIIYRGQSSYIVEAEDEDEAQDAAVSLYHNGDMGHGLGNDWEEVENIESEEIHDQT